MKKIIPFLAGLVLLAACNNASQQAGKQDSSMQTMSKDSGIKMTDSATFTTAMVDNAKDPVCGMPVAAEVGDTVHYNNKVIGFCSKECKDEFMKDAKKSFASVEWKKEK